ncbi:S1C family serine protease [Lachnoclostridium phocaeense]|uniref:S1C family serine protease n=1 Tax=Lachnoclostridium phocaeense TaxID=1871021 RepID=UPI00248E52D5|nr:trypsin-like peptidase domain-containing protein [Lachnoclostridium phocaeense]
MMDERYTEGYNEESKESQEAGQQAGAAGYMDYTEAGSAVPEKKLKKAKKSKKAPKGPMSMKKRWAVLVAMALVFGAVAGGTAFGVNVAASQVYNRKAAENGISNTETVSGTDSTGTVAQVAENAMPSLVTISTMSVEEMRSFFGGTQEYEVEGAGTGVIVGKNDTELLIATNNHVVEGADSLSVGFVDETAVEGQIKGTDATNDLAVVAVKLSDISSDTMGQIKIATIGDSDELVLGEQVVAIGNALGYGQSVTSGYVSALDRNLQISSDNGTTNTYTGLIQTDAPINSGNSGGALLNMKGELIGINQAKSSTTQSGTTVDGIGFAIPINKAQESLQNLMNQTTREKVDESQASYLGIQGTDVSSEASQMYGMPTGVAVSAVVEDGPAAQAGMLAGDIITGFDGRTITGMSQLQDVLQYYAAGETVEVTVQRTDQGEYKEQTVSVTLGSASDAQTETMQK